MAGRGPAGRTDLQRELSGRRHAHLRAEFLAPGRQIISQYYLSCGSAARLPAVIQNGYDTGQYIGREISKLGPFELFFDGDSKKGIPAISWVIKDGADPGYSLFDLSDRLRVRGWQVAAYTMPPNIQDVVVMRVLVRHGFSRDMADLLLEDVKRSIAYLQKHPPSKPEGAAEGTTFTHHALPKTETAALPSPSGHRPAKAPLVPA